MGPTPFSVGDMDFLHDAYATTVGLQWGQRLSALDTGSWRAWCIGGTGFNGANAFQRWIPAHKEAKMGYGEDASMGPTPFSVGYGKNGLHVVLVGIRFNGANAFQRWIQMYLS